MSSVSQVYFNKPINEVTLDDVKFLIDHKIIEDYTLDYKEIPKHDKFDSYAKVISSFLNTKGGILVIGVSEKKKKYPKEITWGKFSKETLIRNLFQKVDPWIEDITIKVIENPSDTSEQIYIVEVPKSKNPPHMGNNVYYYRNVYESIPMNHYQVKSLYTEYYLAKEKIRERVITPIYENIIQILDKSNTIDSVYGTSGYSYVKTKERYLYDQLNMDLVEQIDSFFDLVDERKNIERKLRDYYSDQMKLSIVDHSKGKIKLDEIRNKIDLLHMNYQIPQGLKLKWVYPDLFNCILNNVSPFSEADEKPIEGFEAEIKNYYKLNKNDFLDLFIDTKRRTQESSLFQQYHKLNLDVENVGYGVLAILQNQ